MQTPISSKSKLLTEDEATKAMIAYYKQVLEDTDLFNKLPSFGTNTIVEKRDFILSMIRSLEKSLEPL